MDWFYADSGKQIGPIEEVVFRQLATAGIIKNETLVWRPGMANWQPFQTVEMPVVQPPPLDGAPEGTRFCSECRKPFPPEELAAFGSTLVCADCKPAFTQKLREGILPTSAIRYGGFWWRYLAMLVDGMLLSVVVYIVALGVFGVMFVLNGVNWIDPKQPSAEYITKILILEGVFVFFSMIVSAIYETWMVAKYGATLGKMICKLRVVMVDGTNLSTGRSCGRHFAKYVSGITLYIGYIMAGVDDEKRALHDRMCDTRVIKK